MKSLSCRRGLGRAALAAGLAGILAGCAGAPPRASLELALVPGADAVGRADFRALTASPLYGVTRDMGEKQKAVSPWTQPVERMLQAMGLNEDDVTAALLSLDLDTVNVSQQGWSAADYERASLALAVAVAKPVTLEGLKAGVAAAAGPRAGVTVHDATVAGRPVITVRVPDPGAPTAFGAVSADGLMLFATVNAAAMESLLKREKTGAAEVLSPDLALAAGELAGAQVQAAVALPEATRQAIRESLSQPKGSGEMGLLMAMGLLNPLKALAAVSAGAAFRENLVVTLGLAFSDEANAQQAHTVVQGMILPLVKGASQPDQGQPAVDVGQAVACAVKGKSLAVTVTLSEADLRSTLEKKTARRGGTGPAGGQPRPSPAAAP